MPNKADKSGDRWGSLKDFLDQFPDHFYEDKGPELIYKGPEGYGPLVRIKHGSWRSINDAGIPVAVAWTDWEDGFNINVLHASPVTQALKSYPTSAKACKIPAAWAYTTLDTYIKRMDPDLRVSLGPQQEGLLSGAQDYAGDVPSSGTVDVPED